MSDDRKSEEDSSASLESAEWPEIRNLDTDQEELQPLCRLRDRIFDSDLCRSGWNAEEIFRGMGWTRIIIRGSLFWSDRSTPPPYAEPGSRFYEQEMKEWWEDDPRDELAPLVAILQEDETLEIVHMFPNFDTNVDAVGATVDNPPRKREA